MAVEVFTNDGMGIVSAGGTTAPSAGTVESWTVAVLNPFPAASNSANPATSFYICDQNPSQETEKILVTNISGSTWTVTRGADSSAPVAHTGGFTIVQVVTGASLRTFQQPWVVTPSGDNTGATDPVNVQNAINAYNVAVVTPGVYYGNGVTAHEAQWVKCQPGVVWNMTGTTPAFTWANGTATAYSIYGTGGLTGRPSINGPSGSVNPHDNSVAVQMGDIVQLVTDFIPQHCNTALFLNNQNFWSEQGEHRLFSHFNTNPVIMQCAPTGGTARTGSFDRTRVTVYHNERMDGNFGLGGVQMLAGAQLAGGGITQYGNWSTSGSQTVYALYINGSVPATGANAGTHSSITGGEIIHGMESDSLQTGNPGPGPIFLGASCFVNASGGMLVDNAFSNAFINASATWQFLGPIFTIGGGFGAPSGVANAASQLWTTINSGFPSGFTGTIKYRLTGNNDQVAMQFALTLGTATVITLGGTLYSALPSGFFYATDAKVLTLNYQPFGSPYQHAAVTVNTAGRLIWNSASATTPTGGNSFLYGQAVYSTLV